jgi:hypothetical protein
MSDADDSLDLLVRIKSDTAGAGVAKDALQGVAGAASAAGSSVGKTAGAHDEAGKAAEKHSRHMEGLHKIFGALNQVLPGLGSLMQAAFSPVGATISIAVLALRTFQEHMRKVNEEMKRMEEENAKPLTRRLEAMRETTVSAAMAQVELRERLEHTAHSERGVREEIEKTLEVQKRQSELARLVANANKERELAGLEALHEAGLLSDERYYAAKLAAEEKYRKAKRELEEGDEMRGILAKRRTLELSEMNQRGLKDAADEAMVKRVMAAEDLASLDKAGIEQRHTDSKKAFAEFEDKAGSKRVMAFERAGGVHATRQSLYEALREDQPMATSAANFGGVFAQMEKWQKLKWDANNSEKEWKEAPKNQARLEVAEEKAKAEAARAAKQAVENQDLIDEYRRTLPEQTSALKARSSANAQADQAANDAAREKMKGTAGGAAVAGGAEGLKRLMSGGRWDLSNESDVGEMNNLLGLARLLSSMPAGERGKPEPVNRAGVGFARQESRAFVESDRAMAQQGRAVDSTSRQANAEMVRVLQGLHGLQAETLQTIASHVGSTEELAKDLAGIRKRIDSMQGQVNSRTLYGNG